MTACPACHRRSGKDAVDKEHYTRLTREVGGRFPVSHPSEKNWLENMSVLD